MRINSTKIIGLMAALAAFGVNTAAHADILPDSDSPTATVTASGTFLYSYTTFVSAEQQVETGDFFTIYDFNGFVRVVSAPATFAATVSPTSGPVETTTGTVTPRETDAPNITFTYTGAPTILGGPTPLGTFVLESIFAPSGTVRAFVGRGTDQTLRAKNGNINNITGPGLTVIPEPGEYAFAAFAGASVLGLVVRARRRNAKASV